MGFSILIMLLMSLSVDAIIRSHEYLNHKQLNEARPNIVVIIADDLGWSDVGFHNISTIIKTPHLDQLASEGILLTNHYVQPICSPTRASFLTGRYPFKIGAGLNHGVFNPAEDRGLPTENRLLSEMLKELGYRTALVGKWHLGSSRAEFSPINRGFDTFFGFYNGGMDYFLHNKTDKNCLEENITANFLDLRDQQEIVHDSNVYSEYLSNDRIQSVISENSSTPLFLVASYQNVHEPLQVPDEFLADIPLDVNNERRSYVGMTSFLDASVRNLTEALKKHHKWDNTILLFFSDNGGDPQYGGYNWPLRGIKRTLWEGGIRSASFLSGGFLTSTHTTANALVHVSDWAPTFLRLAGGPIGSKENFDGVDVWGSILNPRDVDINRTIIHNIYKTTYAMRRGNWKLISEIDVGWAEPPEGSLVDFEPPVVDINATEFAGYVHDAALDRETHALFHIGRDPYETKDVSDIYPDVVEEMLSIITKQRGWINEEEDTDRCNKKLIEAAERTGAWGMAL